MHRRDLDMISCRDDVLAPRKRNVRRYTLRARGVREAFESRQPVGGLQRKVELDDRGMFPGTLAP